MAIRSRGASGIELDTKDFLAQSRLFASRYNTSVAEVLRVATGQFAASLAKRPLPTGKGKGSAQKQFRRSIENDIKEAFRVLRPEQGRVRGKELSQSAMMDHLNASRHPSKGSVVRRPSNRPVISDSSAKRLMRKVAKDIGIMQAGWLPAVLRYGGKVPGSVMKHAPGKGTYSERNMGRRNGGIIILTNRVKWASRFYTRGTIGFSAKMANGFLNNLLWLKQAKAIDLFNRMRARAA